MRARVLVALVLAALTMGVVSAQVGQVRLQPRTLTAMQLTPLVRLQEFQGVLKQHKVPGQEQTAAMDKFKSLPGDLQDSIMATIKPQYAIMINQGQFTMARVDVDRLRQRWQLAFLISSIWPSQGVPGAWAYAYGTYFNDDCEVYFDGAPVATYYLDWDFEFFPHTLAFEIPDGASLGVEHAVQVRNATAGKQTGDYMYEIIAPRGYRGIWGWKFHNFSDPTIPWHLYANYFGAGSVEYGDGTHRPAAQQWYDDAYKGAGTGGNCYGMSVSSLRIRNDNFSHMNWATWLNAPANYHDWLWHYDWCTETKETVQQMQGSWYTQEQLDTYNVAANNQDARGCYNRVASLVSQAINRPVLVFWGNGWGHAVVPYGVRVDGDAHEMLVYDNNNQYRETETGDVDPNVATVNWAANTFTCGTGYTGVCVSYTECTPATPHLPGSEYGGPGSNAVALVVSGGVTIQQITDEAGRTFFNPDGSENKNAATRIPLSSRLYPLVQARPVLRQPLTLRAPQLRAPENAPTIFVFSNAVGKALQVSLAGAGEKQCSFYQPGMALAARASGEGQIQLSRILQPAFALEVMDPATLQLTGVRLIRSTRAGDRVFDLQNLRGLDAQTLRLAPLRDGRQLEVQGGAGLQFDVGLQGPVGQGAGVRNFANVSLQANAKALVQPVNWQDLGATRLQIQLRNLQNNNLINRTSIGGQ